jgi:hypothetical protein
MALPTTVRKVIATALLVVFVPLYALFIMALAGGHLRDAGIVIQTAFFAVTGLAWTIPAGAIIWWMLKPPAPKREALSRRDGKGASHL